MNNMLKTIFVVSVMGGALYGAYVLLNENEFRSREALASVDELQEPTIDFGGPAAPDEVLEPGPFVPPGDEASEPGPFVPPESSPWTPPTAPAIGAPASTAAAALPEIPGATSAYEGVPETAAQLEGAYGSASPERFETTSPSPAGGYEPGPSDFNGPSTGPQTSAQYASTGVRGTGFDEPQNLGEPSDLGQESFAPTGEGPAGYTPAEAALEPAAPAPGTYGAGEEAFQPNAESPSAPGSSEFADGSYDPASLPQTTDPAATGGVSGPTAILAATKSFEQSVERAKALVAEKNYRDALAALSIAYGNPDLPEAQATELNDLLDALAAKVIYSQEHLHRQPYVIRQGDTLESIVHSLRVTPEFLVRINGLDPVTRQLPPPGSTLKTVQGPFRAEIRLRSNVAGTLTLFVGELYAGRFDVTLGQDNPPFPGKYTVRDKQTDRPFYTAEGSQISADSPDNPYGGAWIDLGSGISLHGSPATPTPGGQLGCMAIPRDQAADLFSILSIGSTVEVRR